jgi:hypothetical protein
MTTVPAPHRALFGLTLAYVAVLFVWLGEEDSLGLVSGLGAASASLFVAHAIVRKAGGAALAARRWLALAGAAGLLAGAGGALATATLMAVKVSLHGHPGVLDYPPAAVLAVLAALPVWALAGGLAGLGLGLVRLAV